MKKIQRLSALLSGCIIVAFVMVILGTQIFISWKFLGTLGNNQASFIIWGFQIAFSGAIYFVVVPIIRYSANLPVGNYYIPSIFFGLTVIVFTAAQLLSIDEVNFKQACFYVIIPPLVTFLILMKESKREQEKIELKKAVNT